MNAGKLKHQIVIEANTPTRGATGSSIDAWSTFATVRAELIGSAGDEIYGGGDKDTIKVVKVFKIRYLAGILTTMQLVYESDDYDIEDVDNVKGLNKEILIRAVKRA